MNNPFDKIKLSQLHYLHTAISNTKIRHASNIKRIYTENSLFFEETLSLLIELSIVKNNLGELLLTDDFSRVSIPMDLFRERFLVSLFSIDGYIKDTLRNFLVNFHIIEGKIIFEASELEKIKFSDTRNILLELDFIKISENKSAYIVNPDYTKIFLDHFSSKTFSIDLFKRKKEENELIGFQAEKAVLDYETKRLVHLSVSPSEIEHTSLENVMAGYDIKSFEDYLDINSKRIDRYIEVKAVSCNDYKFFWSKNEMEVAKVFGERYYIYLLPISSKNDFDFNNLLIIKNPFDEIFSNENYWEKIIESYSFTKIRKD